MYRPSLDDAMLARAQILATATRNYRRDKNRVEKAQVQFDNLEIAAGVLASAECDLRFSRSAMSTAITEIANTVEHDKRIYNQEKRAARDAQRAAREPGDSDHASDVEDELTDALEDEGYNADCADCRRRWSF